MDLTNLTRLVAATSLIAAAACGAEPATPAETGVTPPAPATSPSGSAQSSPPTASAPTPSTAAPAPAEPAKPAAPAPAAMMPAAMMPAAMMPPAMPAAPSEPAQPANPAAPAAKQYTFEEVMMLPKAELEMAWSAAPAEEIWTGCSRKFAELKHSPSGDPMDTTSSRWGGKCIPEGDKILYNFIDGEKTSYAQQPAELITSFIDDKQACVVTYSGGVTLHFRHMGEDLWVGRQAMGMNPTGIWYPLADFGPAD
jgi:hypothetical protein